MKMYSADIISEIEALSIKDCEKDFYDDFKHNLNGIGITKIIPINGISIDCMYVEENKILFIKFMDTTNEIYSILEEDLIEVMKEDFDNLYSYVVSLNLDIKYNLIYIMPYVDIDDTFGFDDFVENNIIDKSKYNDLKRNPLILKKYFKEKNYDVFLNLFRYYIMPEYHILRKEENFIVNEEFKKIVFSKDKHSYSALFLCPNQLKDINSINYGNTLFLGGSGTGKTTILVSKVIKLSKLYSKEKFLIVTYSKQSMNEIKNNLRILAPNIKNVEVFNFHGFIFKIAKQYKLVINYEQLKINFEKTFKNIILQVKNLFKNKKIYKGIFIDEIENFKYEEIMLLKGINHEHKAFFNIFANKAKDINTNLKGFIGIWDNFDFKSVVYLDTNYRSNLDICDFVNDFIDRCHDKLLFLKDDFPSDYYLKTTSALNNKNNKVQMISVADIEDKISSIIWEIEHLVKEEGLNYSDIAVIYPFNKRKLKNKNTIYFQYILKEALSSKNIPYIICDEDFTNLGNNYGVTLSNVYSVSNLEYRVVIVCEFEMLYNQIISDKVDIEKLVKDINIIYTCITRAIDKLIIISTNKKSDLINLLLEK